MDDEDQFRQMLGRRLGKEMTASFTPEQVAGLRRAFGSRMIGAHGIEIRRHLRLFSRSYYFVVLVGPEPYSAARRLLERPVGMRRLVILLTRVLLLVGAIGAILLIIDAIGSTY